MTDTFQHGRGENINLLTVNDCGQSRLSGNQFRHFDYPMPLHRAIYILIVNLAEIIGKPVSYTHLDVYKRQRSLCRGL